MASRLTCGAGMCVYATQCIQGYLSIAAKASASAEYWRRGGDGEHIDHN